MTPFPSTQSTVKLKTTTKKKMKPVIRKKLKSSKKLCKKSERLKLSFRFKLRQFKNDLGRWKKRCRRPRTST
jgi:hypothetical protein